MQRIKLISLGVNFEVSTFETTDLKIWFKETILKSQTMKKVYGSLFRMEQNHIPGTSPRLILLAWRIPDARGSLNWVLTKMCCLFYFEILFFQYIKSNQDFTCKYTITFYHATSFWSLRNEAWALTPVLRWGCSKRGNRASDCLLSPIGWMFLLMNLAWRTWSICSVAFVFSRHLFDSWTSLWSFATKSLDIASSFRIFAIWPSLWMALSLASCKEASSSWIFC